MQLGREKNTSICPNMALILTKNAKCFLQKIIETSCTLNIHACGETFPFLKQKLMPEHFVNVCKAKFWTGLFLAHAKNKMMTFLFHFTASHFTPSDVQKLLQFINQEHICLPINNTISLPDSSPKYQLAYPAAYSTSLTDILNSTCSKLSAWSSP